MKVEKGLIVLFSFIILVPFVLSDSSFTDWYLEVGGDIKGIGLISNVTNCSNGIVTNTDGLLFCADLPPTNSYNATYDTYAYNQTTPATDWVIAQGYITTIGWLNVVFLNETTLNDTYVRLDDINNSYALNSSLSTYDTYAYNMTTPAIDYANTSLMRLDGSNWNGDSWITWADPNFVFNESKLATTYYNATESDAITGTVDAGTLADTQHDNGIYDGITFNFSEASGSPALDLRINFTDITSFNQGVMRYKTSSLSGAFPIIQMWNYGISAWEDYPAMATSLVFATITQQVFDATEHIGADGIVQMRIYKASNGNTGNRYYVDWITISAGFGTPSGEEIDPYSWHKDVEDSGDYNTTGNVTAAYFVGDGSLLSGVTGTTDWTNVCFWNETTMNSTYLLVGENLTITDWTNVGFINDSVWNNTYLTGIDWTNVAWLNDTVFNLTYLVTGENLTNTDWTNVAFMNDTWANDTYVKLDNINDTYIQNLTVVNFTRIDFDGGGYIYDNTTTLIIGRS